MSRKRLGTPRERALYEQRPVRLRRALASERRRTAHCERRLSGLETQLVEQRRLAAIVAHDLRSPLHAVSVALSLLEAECPAQTQRPLRLARSSLSRAGTLLNDLLQLAVQPGGQISAQRLARAQLSDLVAHAVEEARLRFPQRTVLLEDHTEPLWVEVDVAQMAQVLDNLISNALVHSPPTAVVAVQVCCQGSDACVAVENQGAIAPRVLTRLFEPMNRGESSAHVGSLGLGLYIAKRLVDAQSGRIELECHDARTRFRVLLPRVAAPAEG